MKLQVSGKIKNSLICHHFRLMSLEGTDPIKSAKPTRVLHITTLSKMCQHISLARGIQLIMGTGRVTLALKRRRINVTTRQVQKWSNLVPRLALEVTEADKRNLEKEISVDLAIVNCQSRLFPAQVMAMQTNLATIPIATSTNCSARTISWMVSSSCDTCPRAHRIVYR